MYLVHPATRLGVFHRASAWLLRTKHRAICAYGPEKKLKSVGGVETRVEVHLTKALLERFGAAPVTGSLETPQLVRDCTTSVRDDQLQAREGVKSARAQEMDKADGFLGYEVQTVGLSRRFAAG